MHIYSFIFIGYTIPKREYIIISHIIQEPVDMAVWREIHPRIAVISRDLFCDGALLTENGVYHFADLFTASEKDYRRGIQSIFEGTFAAYRNPSAHENLSCTKREAMEQIMLAS